MKVSAINPAYSNIAQARQIKRVAEPETKPAIGFTSISFKGGNPEQMGIWGAELPPYNKVGGVATVGEDFRALRVSENDPIVDSKFKQSFDYYRQKNKFNANPIYNSSLIYENGILKSLEVAKIPTGLPEDSTFKPYEGKYFMTNNGNFRKYRTPKEFFENEDKIIKATGKPNLILDRNVFILEDVTGEKKMMDFGDTGETEIKLYQTMRMNPESKKLEPIHDFHVWVDLTASMPKPYANGSYSSSPRPLAQTWQGNAYAKASKAFVELMPRITELTSIDPATVLLNDMQAAPVINYMAEKAANGDEYINGKHAGLITHNTQEGYIERSSNQNMFIDIADKELREAVEKDPEFITALKQGDNALEAYFKKLLPEELFDKQGLPSQFMLGVYYLEQGYLPQMSGVSEKYIEKAATDPNFIPALYPILNRLYTNQKIVGINNGFENESMNPYELPGMVGYNTESILGKTEDFEGFKIKPFRAFDKNLFNETNIDMNHVREVKKDNTINLMERFNPELLTKLKELKNVPGHEYDLNIAIAGLPDKNVDVYGHIDPKFVEAAKEGKDVKVASFIGRGDAQKALDTVLESFEQYVIKHGEEDPYTVLILGGDFEHDSVEGQKILKVAERMNANPLLKGRFALNRGFSPNKPFFLAGSVAILPSRFAPFELTDLEAMKVGCTPLVPNGQGMAQKNYDTAFDGEAQKATSYKTPDEYQMSLETVKKLLPEEDNKKLEKELNEFYKEIKDDYYLKNGKTMTDEACLTAIFASAALTCRFKDELLRPYKDKIMATEMAEGLRRALIEDRNKDGEKLRLQNQLKMNTKLEENGELSKTGKSTAERYRELHVKREAGKITKEETLLSKMKKNAKNVYERVNKAEANPTPPTGTNGTSVKGVSGKTAALIAAGVAIVAAGITYFATKNAKNKEADKEEKNLSCVG